MKKLFYLLLVFYAWSLLSCKKEDSSPGPVSQTPLFIGKWKVDEMLVDSATNVATNAFHQTFDLELFENETALQHLSFDDWALEWDLINNDQTIVISNFYHGNGQAPFWIITAYDIKSQTADAGLWVEKGYYSIQDSLGNLTGPYYNRWTLQKQ